MNAAEIAARNEEIVELKARGVSHARIARTLNVSEDTVYWAVRKFRESNPSLRTHDPIDIIDSILEGYLADLEELAIVSSTTKNDAVRVGAINSRMGARDRIVALMQATGVLPHDLGKLSVELDIRYVSQRMVTIFEKYGLPQEAMEEFVGLMVNDSSN